MKWMEVKWLDAPATSSTSARRPECSARRASHVSISEPIRLLDRALSGRLCPQPRHGMCLSWCRRRPEYILGAGYAGALSYNLLALPAVVANGLDVFHLDVCELVWLDRATAWKRPLRSRRVERGASLFGSWVIVPCLHAEHAAGRLTVRVRIGAATRGWWSRRSGFGLVSLTRVCCTCAVLAAGALRWSARGMGYP